MSKKVAKICKLQFPAGGARPGPALASAGINMPQFCTAFNDATKDRAGDMVPVIITAYEDKSFDFVLKFGDLYVKIYVECCQTIFDANFGKE